MRLYSILYGNGVDRPLLTEENALFEDIGAAVDHADKTLHDLVGRQGESLRAGDLFALVDEFQGEVRRVPCGVSKNDA